MSQHKIIVRYAKSTAEKVDIVALAIAKQAIQDIVGEELKENKSMRKSKEIIKYLGTGRGEHIVRSQENH